MRTVRLVVLSVSLAVSLAVRGMLVVTPLADVGYPPFASSRYCRYHLAGASPKSCVSRDVYRWWKASRAGSSCSDPAHLD